MYLLPCGVFVPLCPFRTGLVRNCHEQRVTSHMIVLPMTQGGRLLIFVSKGQRSRPNWESVYLLPCGVFISLCPFRTGLVRNCHEQRGTVCYFLCRLRSKVAHRDHFIQRLSVCLSGYHSYVLQATRTFLRMLPLCYNYRWWGLLMTMKTTSGIGWPTL